MEGFCFPYFPGDTNNPHPLAVFFYTLGLFFSPGLHFTLHPFTDQFLAVAFFPPGIDQLTRIGVFSYFERNFPFPFCLTLLSFFRFLRDRDCSFLSTHPTASLYLTSPLFSSTKGAEEAELFIFPRCLAPLVVKVV